MNAASERRLTRPLAAVTLVLGVLLLALFTGLGRGVHWEPPRPVPPPPTTTAAAALPPPVPLEQFAEVWQKPLFSPDRKPTMHAAGTNSNLGEMQLTGIILTNDLRMALLRDKKSGQEVRVREGDALPDGSWTLSKVRARSALFDSSGGRAELKLPAGAPIDTVHVGPKAPANEPSPAREEQGTAPAGAESDQAPGPGQGVPVQGAPAPGESAAPTDQPAPAASQDSDLLQARRVQRLRETIMKRRAAQAAAAREGDH